MTVARAARYQHLVKEAAEQLNCGVDSELARHVGILRLARETFAERLITGKEVNPADLVRLDDCLRQYLPLRAEPSEPLAVVVDRQRARQDALQREARNIEVSPSGRVRILPKPGSNSGNDSRD
jgi:hypothetical protein